MSWRLQRIEGSDVVDVGLLPSHMSVAEVETALQRLVCTRLTEQEIVAASLRKDMGGHSILLERVGASISIGVGEPISFGHGEVQFITKKEADDA